MNILAFEFLSSGGVANQYPLDSSLAKFQQQGSKMLKAVCEDFSQLGHQVVCPLDSKLSLDVSGSCSHVPVGHEDELDDILLRAADQADSILAICPESDGCLERFLRLLSPWDSRLISPNLDFARLTGNKWNCFRWLHDCKVPCPRTFSPLNGKDVSSICETAAFPLVVKPVDGAGSERITMVTNGEQLPATLDRMIIQEFAVGTPASVSVIMKSSGEAHFCEPGEQIFSDYPFGPHIQTKFPLTGDLRERAMRLANLVVRALPRTRGYFGIDMVLGRKPNEDVVIEVNPRMTTSYCDLRKWSEANLAEIMLQ